MINEHLLLSGCICLKKGGDSQYSMRCDLDKAVPGPCVLQSPTVVGESSDLGFCCVELAASSDNVIFGLAINKSGATAPVSRNVTLKYVDHSYSGTACIAIPNSFEGLYRIQLSATSYFTSPSSAEWAEVLSFRVNDKDTENIGLLHCFNFAFKMAEVHFKLYNASSKGSVELHPLKCGSWNITFTSRNAG